MAVRIGLEVWECDPFFNMRLQAPATHHCTLFWLHPTVSNETCIYKKIDQFYSIVAFILIRETIGTQKSHVTHGSISHVDARPLMAWVFEQRLLVVWEVYRKYFFLYAFSIMLSTLFFLWWFFSCHCLYEWNVLNLNLVVY